MLILDTDHFSEPLRGTASGQRLASRIDDVEQSVATTIVTLEELARGWLARIRSARHAEEYVDGYAKLQRLLSVANDWTILAWTLQASAVFDELKARKLKIGTMDLRIAVLTIAHGGRLLSRNLRDCARIDGLEVRDWLA